MLWLCLSLPQLPVSALDLAPGSAIADQRGSRRWLSADAASIAAGTLLADALLQNPQLAVHARKPAAERHALQRLAWWIYRYGSPVVGEILDMQEAGRCPRARLWVEVGASLKLFGGFANLQQALFTELLELGHAARCALAPTRAGAALLAEAGGGAGCFDRDSLRRALQDVPIAQLPWPTATLTALAGTGLRRLGELFELPRESFARRFGETRLHDLDCLRGLAPEPYRAITPPPRYARRFELAGEIETVEPLLFPLKRLCAELAAYLRARDTGVCALRISFAHALGAPTDLELRFLAPTRDAARLFATLQERLLREAPAHPVRELLLEAEEFATPAPLQGDLFDRAGAQRLEWDQALERIVARLGEDAVWTPACVADHRPERAWAKAPPGTAACSLPAPRPAWLLAQPQALARAPATLQGRGELIESGWWDGADSGRCYYSATTADGARVWVYRDRADGQWYLHGIWS